MFKRCSFAGVVLAVALALSACSGGGLSLEPAAGPDTAGQPATDGALAPAESGGETAAQTVTESTAVQPTTETTIVDVTPMTDAELAAQPPGETAPGGAAGDVVDETDPGETQPSPPVGWMTYTDPTYGYTVAYPSDFVVAMQDTAPLAQFSPAPESSVFFMNPTMAAGDLAGIEPPDLEVRIYPAGSAASLEAWLVESQFVPADASPVGEPFQTGNAAGLKVCASTMIAPGCSFYFLHNGRVYQLTPATLEGEAMVPSFAFTG
jgi:hypothetical protein